MRRFDGDGVLVTGGSSGIGAACVRAFADEGARVVAAGRHEERLASVRAAAPDLITTVVADLSDPSRAGAMVDEAIERLGGLSVLVNNAGVALDGSVLETTQEIWRTTMAVNLDAAFVAAQRAAQHMVGRGGGAIVNVASIDGLVPEAPLLAYNVSKAGLLSLTRTFALELGHRGVRTNAVAPGETLTPMTADDAADVRFRDAYLAQIPAQRFGEPEEVAAAILFLASGDASYVNGATLVVDGGALAGSWYYPWQRPVQRRSEGGAISTGGTG